MKSTEITKFARWLYEISTQLQDMDKAARGLAISHDIRQIALNTPEKSNLTVDEANALFERAIMKFLSAHEFDEDIHR